MLAKKTSKNQVTLPKSVAKQFPQTEYFDVRVQRGAIVLEPVDIKGSERVRNKLRELGIKESDVREAVAWARKTPQ